MSRVPLAYENATSGERALQELSAILTRFGCTRFGTMTDMAAGEMIVQFTYRGRDVLVKASMRGYAAAWMRAHPVTIYKADEQRGSAEAKRLAHERKALEQARISVHSVLRDWIKGQVTAVETGILTFEGAFLGQILLGSGKTVLDHVTDPRLALLKLLPA